MFQSGVCMGLCCGVCVSHSHEGNATLSLSIFCSMHSCIILQFFFFSS